MGVTPRQPHVLRRFRCLVLLGLVVLFASCHWDAPPPQAAKLLEQDCSKFAEADKQHWCRGDCGKVENESYRAMCKRAQSRLKQR